MDKIFYNINNWLNNIYWDAVVGIFSALNVIILGTLTFIIIIQTKKNTENQILLEERITKYQNKLQLRQLKIDIFPYKREIFLNLYKVLEFSNHISSVLFQLDLESKSTKDIYDMFNTSKDVYNVDFYIVIRSLREAEYILPSNISSTVLEICRSFDEMCSSFLVMGSVEKIFDDSKVQEIKLHNLNRIKERCKHIESKNSFIQSIFPSEINIGNLDR